MVKSDRICYTAIEYQLQLSKAEISGFPALALTEWYNAPVSRREACVWRRRIVSLFTAFILGIIQGVSEFLPISSSGHLSIAQNLFQIQAVGEKHLFFDVLLHFGTMIAIFIAYWKDIVEMVREFFLGAADIARGTTPKPVPPARRLILLIVIATLPLFVVLPIKKAVESLYYNTVFIAIALLITGCLLFFSDRVRRGRKTERTATWKDALIVGVGQALATLPGISRSGTTITTGTFLGFQRKFAVRFSFLMSIPAVLGATLLDLIGVIKSGGVDMSLTGVYIVGILSAAVSGYLSIFLIRMIADKGRFGAFAYYCWFAGASTLILTFLL